MMADTDFTQTARNMRRRTTKLERAGDYWSQQEVDQLKMFFSEGVGITGMAIHLQPTEPAVIQQIEKLDLCQRKNIPIAGERPATIAAYHAAPVRLPRAPVPTVNATASSRSTNKC